jgi:hypothetical protein
MLVLALLLLAALVAYGFTGHGKARPRFTVENKQALSITVEAGRTVEVAIPFRDNPGYWASNGVLIELDASGADQVVIVPARTPDWGDNITTRSDRPGGFEVVGAFTVPSRTGATKGKIFGSITYASPYLGGFQNKVIDIEVPVDLTVVPRTEPAPLNPWLFAWLCVGFAAGLAVRGLVLLVWGVRRENMRTGKAGEDAIFGVLLPVGFAVIVTLLARLALGYLMELDGWNEYAGPGRSVGSWMVPIALGLALMCAHLGIVFTEHERSLNRR